MKAFIPFILISAMALSACSTKAEDSKNAISAVDTQTSQVEPVNTPTANQPALTELIRIEDPFDGPDSVGATILTSAKNPYSDLVSVMDYSLGDGSVTEYSGDFNQMIFSSSDITSGETVMIAQRLKFDGEGVLAWAPATDGGTFSWNNDPSREAMPFGSEATVIFTNPSGTIEWQGNIDIHKPTT